MSSSPNPPLETVLLAVTGMSPAILTETLWALYRQECIPDRVLVITTEVGKDQMNQQLLTPLADWEGLTVWSALRMEILGKAWKSDARLQLEEIRVMTSPNARTGKAEPLSDIRDRSDNDAAGDFILNELRKLAFDDDTQIIASIAGGRKTMSALLYACMTLLGREMDRLTHVLVKEPFDHPKLAPRFYFPTSRVSQYKLKNDQGQVLREYTPAEAEIELADVPFPKLRRLFPEILGRWPGRFTRLVDLFSERIREIPVRPVLEYNDSKGVFLLEGKPISLVGREHPLFAFLFHRAITACTGIRQGDCTEPFLEFLEQWYEKHPEFRMRYSDRDGHDFDWMKTFDPSDLRRPLSDLRKKLEAHNLAAFIPYLFPLRSPLGFQISPESHYAS